MLARESRLVVSTINACANVQVQINHVNTMNQRIYRGLQPVTIALLYAYHGLFPFKTDTVFPTVLNTAQTASYDLATPTLNPGTQVSKQYPSRASAHLSR